MHLYLRLFRTHWQACSVVFGRCARLVLIMTLLLSSAQLAQATAPAQQGAMAPSTNIALLSPPVADFSSDLRSGVAPLKIQFTDRSQDSPTSWSWDFGDGASATEANPAHTYTAAGIYHVKLVVSNAAGEDMVIRKNYMIVNTPPSNLDPFVGNADNPLDNEVVRTDLVGAAAVAAEPSAPSLQSPANGATNVPSPATLTTCVTDPDGGALTVTFYGRDISPLTVPDFTLVAIPDTQNYYTAGGGSAVAFLKQAQWIANNRASRNIVFVTHLGDVVNDGSTAGSGDASGQWATASSIMTNIEQAATGILDGIPYGIAVGNHDQGPSYGDPTKTVLYNQYFGISRFNGRQYYGGHLGSDNDNHFDLFTVGDLKFIIIHLEFDTSNRPATFTWVDSVLQTYPDRLAIISAHEIIHNSAEWRSQGLKIWNGVRDNPNVFLMLAGHISGEARRQDVGYHGNVVNTLLSDYQSRSNGGDGYFRYMEFSGSTSEVLVYTYSATRLQYEQDANSFFQIAVDSPSSAPLRRPFQIIARQTGVSSGSCPSATWNSVTANRQYEWYVGVSDSPTDPADVMAFSSKATFSTGTGSAPPQVKFGSATYNVNENAGPALITVSLSQPATDPVTVNYATSNGTASSDSDYTATAGTLTFDPGQTSKTFDIAITDNGDPEPSETVNLTLSNANNATLGTPASAILTIADNDNTTGGTSEVFLSSNSNGTASGLAYRDEDILGFNLNTNTWRMVFDGSDVGAGNVDVDAFAWQAATNSFLLSFDVDFTLTGLGAVDESDIVRFAPTKLGDTTTGIYSWYFDGSDVGLDTSEEDIDGIDFDANGKLLISTRGAFSAAGASGKDEDLFVFNVISLGETTAGSFAIYFDGSVVGLTDSSEDVMDTWSDSNAGKLYLTTAGNFAVTGLNGDGNDIFICQQTGFGAQTACTFSLFKNMGALGLGTNLMDSLAIGELPANLFTATVQASMISPDDTVEYPGDDADEPDAIESDEADEQNKFLFLPIVTR